MAYTWVAGGSRILPAQTTVRYTKDDIDFFVDVNDLSAAPAVGADFTILPAGYKGMVPDVMARCLCVTYFTANTGAARGITLRIRGLNQFGQGVEETVTFATKAKNTTNITFTRNAYRVLSQVTYMAQEGTVNANDRVDIGLAVLSATAAGTHDATNGSGSTDYKAFGVHLPVLYHEALGTAADGDYAIQIHGHILAEDGTSGVQTWAEMSKANDFNYSDTYAVLTPDEEFVAALGAGASNVGMVVTTLPTFQRTISNPVTALASILAATTPPTV